FDTARMHVLDHRGDHLKVRGPLNVARPVQGWPVIVQAGASEAGRQFAAEVAEVIFGSSNNLADGRRFYADVKGRVAKAGRDPDHLKILPGCFVVVGSSEDEAREKKARLDALVHPDSGLGSLSAQLGVDVSGFDLDAPLPTDLPPTNASKSAREKLLGLSHRHGISVRQLAQMIGGSFGSLEMIGTPAMIADEMEEWLESGGSDGFNILFPTLPQGLDEFVDKVVPELQRRGLFRHDYEGRTLRENLGLPRPENRFFPRG
ncbi:MAG: NtaA/DmoA family FMN-dependent monooxygenase, partial [Stellaceae bacterium]